LGGKVKKFGTTLSKATLPLAGVLTGGYKMFLDLDKGIRQVTTLADKEILPVEQIRKDTKRISDLSGIAQTEIAGAMYDALSSGVDSSKVVGFTESAVKLTKAGFTDMGTVVDATTTVLNAYGEEADSVNKIHDIFVKTQDLGKITVDQLGQSIGRVIPIAAASGVKLNQLGTAYSILTARGIDANQSTTAINSLLNELSSSGTKADKVLRQKTGKSFTQLTKDGKNLGEVLKIIEDSANASGMSLNDMFGNLNASKAATSLAKAGLEEYNKVLGQMNSSDGSVESNFNDMIGPAERFAMTTERVKNALIEIGAEAAPYIDKVSNKISELTQWFANLDDGTKSTIVQWALLLVAAGPLIAIFGTILGVLGKLFLIGGFVLKGVGLLVSLAGILGQGFMFIVSCANPLMWIFLAVGGVVIWLKNHFSSIKARADELGGGFGWLKAIVEEAGGSFSWMGDKAMGALNRVRDKWEEVKAFLKNPIKGVISIVSNVVNKVKSIGSGGAKSHATGLDYVPYDNYLANLHKGEIVLTAKASEEYRALGGDKDRVPRMTTNNNTTNNRN
ncbi:phage tail tape measure protein, partial [uncultured Anaerococcus sp.]|uniref:phage tail tape measure protein n=1 Tax=uncultured Anaerococcus sp. TaxID=293428 RepID=UPI0026186A90